MYVSTLLPNGTFIKKLVTSIPYKIIIVDELSMVPLEMMKTLLNFNVYIIDDGSNDCICNEISKFNSYLNIKYLKCPHIGKPGLVRNYGLENSNGDYIMFCDSDDFFAPKSLVAANPSFSLCNTFILSSNFSIFSNLFKESSFLEPSSTINTS